MNDSIELPMPFYKRAGVEIRTIPVGPGVPLGIEKVSSPILGIGGAYAGWGQVIDNDHLPAFVQERLGETLDEQETLHLSELGFLNRHHLPLLSPEEDIEVEVEVGAQVLREAASACGWSPEEVEGVLIGMSGPISKDYTEEISRKAGIPDSAVKVSVHKACDSSVGGLHLALNPSLLENQRSGRNLARELEGKKVLVGGIEGLSRLLRGSRDKQAYQLFGNGAGIIGIIPGKTMRFLVGKSHEVFDEEGVLEVRMMYPHSGRLAGSTSLIEVSNPSQNHIRVAGLMHEPEDESSVVMAGPMGMVKLFVRSGVEVVRDVYQAYQDLMAELGNPEKSLATAIVHHANLKINKLKEKNLQKVGIRISMPWVLSEFGNVSAASNMIAFLRTLTTLKPGDHVLIDGFGAGTYYDTLAVDLPGVP